MTWSFNKSGVSVNEALTAVENSTDSQLPPSVRSYIKDGIQSLQTRYGDDTKVTVSASGHLFNGESGYSEQTTANIDIRADQQSIQTGQSSRQPG